MKMGFTLTLERGAGRSELYFEVACVVIVFILAGRYFEARAKRTSGAALRALLDLGAKDVAVLRHGSEVRIPIGELTVGDIFIVRPGEKVATDGTVEEGTRPSTPRCSPANPCRSRSRPAMPSPAPP